MKLENLSALEIGKLVNRKAISAKEVVNYFCDRVESNNSKLNAFTYLERSDALEEASRIDKQIADGEKVGPLAGVPVALKDFLPSKRGWTASHGGVPSLVTQDTEDSRFYAAAKSLGAIAIGKTNAPSFGFRGTTDNVMYGATKNPFDLSRNSGGSSGGSAAAVGAGFVSIAEGGDAGGSIRIPAAWCGCFGFKPSAGLVPSVCRPDAWTATHPYCCGGPISRTVDDAAVIFEAMQGYDPRDPLSIPFKRRVRYLKGEGLKGLKVGVTYSFGGLFPHPEEPIAKAITFAVDDLRRMGAGIVAPKFKFNYSRREYEEAWLRGICIDTAIDMELWKKDGYDLAGDHADEVPEQFIYWNDVAIKSTMMDYRKFHDIRTDILDAHLNAFKDCDVIIAPVTGCLPVKNAEEGLTEGPSHIGNEKVDPLIGFGYTYLENMIGFPAASVPCVFSVESPAGLPIGIQVIAPRYKDQLVFQVAYAIEHYRPWNYDGIQV